MHLERRVLVSGGAGFRGFRERLCNARGTPIRDYVQVSDLAEGHVGALARLLAGGPCGAFNLGTGTGYSVKQVLDVIAAETSETLSVLDGPARR